MPGSNVGGPDHPRGPELADWFASSITVHWARSKEDGGPGAPESRLCHWLRQVATPRRALAVPISAAATDRTPV